MAKTEEKQEMTGGIQVPEVYANTVKITHSQYEYEITLGLGSSNYEGIKPVVNIRISPQFAKEWAKIFSDNIKLFEENMGKMQ
jgi:hypothetical protein